jgi:hypothetical protein
VLGSLSISLSAVGVVITALLALAFLRDPQRGLVQTTHRLELLPLVMADRYVAFTLLALAATLYGDFAVIAGLFSVFAFMGFADAWIYARAGHPFTKHLFAGLAASLVAVIGLAAVFTNGAT